MSQLLTVTVPAGVRAHRLETNRGAFAALEALPTVGTVPHGTALLVPGFTGSKEDFIPLLQPLATAGFRTVALDGRGQHETGGTSEESSYAQGELARDVIAQTHALQEAYPGPVHLLGHSFGGLVARAAVLGVAGSSRPWASLTLMSSGPAAVSEGQQARLELLISALAAMEMTEIWDAMCQLGSETAPNKADAADSAPSDVEDFMRQRWLNTTPAQLIAAGRQMRDEPDRVDELAAVDLPKLVISGHADVTWPVPWLDEMATRLSAQRTLIAGGGHSPNVHRPHETAAALVEFWMDATCPRRSALFRTRPATIRGLGDRQPVRRGPGPVHS
jgi:pimeloyl-ACP methyl ester carboxylesterase